jgi:hypothetical protein
MLRFQPRLFSVTLIALILLVAGPLALATAQEATPGTDEVTIIGPDDSYGGATLGEWSARQWQWQTSFPPELNPGNDPTGAMCGYGQSGPVFFLPSFVTEGELMCVIPAGTAIFVPIVEGACSTVEAPPFFGRTEAELRACAIADIDSVYDVSATVDGTPVEQIEDYRVSTPLFTFNFGENNVWELAPGVAHAVGDGYQFIIAPLPAGEHEIVVTGTYGEPEIQVESATYRVIVEAPQIIEPEGSPEAATPVA